MRIVLGFMILLGWTTTLAITNAQDAHSARDKAMQYCITATGGALGSEQACEKEVYGER